MTNEPQHEISNNVVCATSKGSDQPAHTRSINAELLTEHQLEFLSLKGGCTGWSESTLVKMPHCWKLYVTAQITPYPQIVKHDRYQNLVNCLNYLFDKIINEPLHEISNNVAFLTRVDSDEPLQPPFKLRNSK